MFSADEIVARLHKKPYQPLRIRDSDGHQYDIFYPDLVRVTRDHVMIGWPDSSNPSVYDRITYVGLMYIVALDDLPTPPAISGNGSQGPARFTAEEILARLRQEPFKPLRIVVSEGPPHDVIYPTLVRVGRRDIMIGFSDCGDPYIYDRSTRVGLEYIIGLEDLPTPGTSDNGAHP